ncbi:nuclear elongation and deformation protein 1 [Anopheles sinensis]|uniref:Nuclear elongation and deformation protein 1 n=1 Tax=Anopheles sinensis TaxID=74873 RepID=A0A084WU60_ANOSI|nr:nuclear elongation and deformation protein 1 [Anopheles sinensis]
MLTLTDRSPASSSGNQMIPLHCHYAWCIVHARESWWIVYVLWVQLHNAQHHRLQQAILGIDPTPPPTVLHHRVEPEGESSEGGEA